jgi:hypothetical protein
VAKLEDELLEDTPTNEEFLRALKPGDRSPRARAARMLAEAAKRSGIVSVWRCTKCEATAKYARRAPQPLEHGCRAPGGHSKHVWKIAAKYAD